MCGIMGVIGARPQKDWESWGMLTAHRGPDAFGLWHDEHALLGHNRLSIIDLSTAANQPMVLEDGRYVIVFNGEIFNFLSLRSELVAAGVRFRTRSDTEVLLQGYRKWGRNLLDRLDGMFAFAIWDVESRTLFVARDHIGIKPVYYRHELSRFVFGSELKLLTSLDGSQLRLRHASLLEYLVYGYIPAPYTPFMECHKLLPGHCLEYKQRTGELVLSRWWHVPAPASGPHLDYEEACTTLRELFHQSVKERMISDVPLGAFLSGGIDSSAIVSEMASVSAVKTFSIGYRDNSEYDETYYAKKVADHLKVEHTVLYPEFAAVDMQQFLETMVQHFDEPYGNATCALTYLLTKAAREHVTVALCGDGGDELFGGYPRYRALLLANKARALLRPVIPMTLSFLTRLPETPKANHLVRRSRRFFSSLAKPSGQAFQDWTSYFRADEVASLMLAAGISVPPGTRLAFIRNLFDEAGEDIVGSACYADQNSFLPYNLLEGADRMSMANGFELRLPFVSRSMLEFAAALPTSWKIQGGNQKRLLKDVYRSALPEEVVRRKKRGFNPPVWHWLQAGKPFVDSVLKGEARIYQILDRTFVMRQVDAFYSQRLDNSMQLWSLIVLEYWLQSLPLSCQFL
ncbi:asparagine synthase (glutamine-hydrolyzing) [Geomonas terrae]|uniref:asparagine synthase (glutamine-hydrolyzing) n=1 Tax=Geomonas terrae TaxID=2562681 RepID=A0A4S1CB80_9BACT|nr:asparagine synthase (glutamine-hydrolyzing) [Geomonas terrae]TGU70589.1 asparagine synthase (glutamine-hydrolyzing) [Geomonas terrae]